MRLSQLTEVVEDVITELEPSSEPTQEAIDVVFEPLLEVVEHKAPTQVEIVPDVGLNQPENTELGSKTFSFDRLIEYLKTLDASDISQLIAKLKQFPIDFLGFCWCIATCNGD